MTCILSITHSFSLEDSVDLPNRACRNYDIGWINAQSANSGLFDIIHSDTSHLSSTSGSERCNRHEIRVESTNAGGDDIDPDYSNIEVDRNHLKTADERVGSTANAQSVDTSAGNKNTCTSTGRFEIPGPEHKEVSTMCRGVTCNTSNSIELEKNKVSEHVNNQAMKRKAETSEDCVTCTPAKRISPFWNTPKEKKEEKRKLLKMSMKKLKQIEDPEVFLRRTVLVNNTVKRLQNELREENSRNKRFSNNFCNGYGVLSKYCNEFSVLSSQCLSNSYLFDDPFLKGFHEKITDDMTEVLIRNVLNDKPNDTSSVAQESQSRSPAEDGSNKLQNITRTLDIKSSSPSFNNQSHNIAFRIDNRSTADLNDNLVNDHLRPSMLFGAQYTKSSNYHCGTEFHELLDIKSVPISQSLGHT